MQWVLEKRRKSKQRRISTYQDEPYFVVTAITYIARKKDIPKAEDILEILFKDSPLFRDVLLSPFINNY